MAFRLLNAVFEMARRAAAISVLVTGFGAGCEASPPAYSAHFVDEDFTSAAAQGAHVRLGIQGTTVPPTASQFLPVVSSASFAISPDGSPLSSFVDQDLSDAPPVTDSSWLPLRLNWDAQSIPGWHFVGVSMDDMDMTIDGYVHRVGGRIGIRISFDDRPVLARVQFAMKNSDVEYLQLVFSQPVRLRNGVALGNAFIAAGGPTNEGVACSEVGDGSSSTVTGGAALKIWTLACDRYPESWTLRLTEDVVSLSGSSLANLEGVLGRELQFSWSELESMNGYRMWRER